MGSLSPCSHLANALGSTPDSSAASFCEIPKVMRCRTRFSPHPSASGSGSQLRNRIIEKGAWPPLRLGAAHHCPVR